MYYIYMHLYMFTSLSGVWTKKQLIASALHEQDCGQYYSRTLFVCMIPNKDNFKATCSTEFSLNIFCVYFRTGGTNSIEIL